MSDFRRGKSSVAKPYPRTARFNEALRHAIATEIERLADADERLNLITVTGVDCDPDLRKARVFLASLTEDAAIALEEERVRMQGAIAKNVRAKRTPQLSFEVDPAVISGQLVEDTLRALKSGVDQPGPKSEG